MKNVHDFTLSSVAKLRRDVGLIDLCICRFASWSVSLWAYECALCQTYLKKNKSLCGACPIARDGHANCEGTPFSRAAGRADEEMCWSGGDPAVWLTANDCAAEIRYLLGLRRKLTKALAAKVEKAAWVRAARRKARAKR